MITHSYRWTSNVSALRRQAQHGVQCTLSARHCQFEHTEGAHPLSDRMPARCERLPRLRLSRYATMFSESMVACRGRSECFEDFSGVGCGGVVARALRTTLRSRASLRSTSRPLGRGGMPLALAPILIASRCLNEPWPIAAKDTGEQQETKSAQ